MSNWQTIQGIKVPGADPTGDAGLVLKDDLNVLALRSGSILGSCDAVATSVISSLNNPTTIDGVSLGAGSRVLLTAQTTGSENGPWEVQAGPWRRPDDFATAMVFSRGGLVVPVVGGTLGGGTTWLLGVYSASGSPVSGTGEITVGTTALAAIKLNPPISPLMADLDVSTYKLKSTVTGAYLDLSGQCLLNSAFTVVFNFNPGSLALNDNSGIMSVDLIDRFLFDDNISGGASLDWQDRLLYAADGSTIVVDWSSGDLDIGSATLKDGSGAYVDIHNEKLYTSEHYLSIDWQAGSLHYLGTVAESLDWDNGSLKNSDGVEVLNWKSFSNGAVFFDVHGNVSLAASLRQCYDSGGNDLSVDWDTRNLYNSLGNSTVDWENLQLSDTATNLSLDWDGRQLWGESVGLLAIDWSCDSGAGVKIRGATDASVGGVGYVGQVITSTVANTTNTLTTDTAANITSISLTAGDWDVYGCVEFKPNAATTASYLECGITTTSATIPTTSGDFAAAPFGLPAGVSVSPSLVAPMQRVNVSASTTVYLVAKAGFLLNAMQAGGRIYARRRR